MPTMRFPLYNPSNIATTFVSSEKYAADARRAGARAILRHHFHTVDHLATHSNGGLHPLYMSVHGLGVQNRIELEENENMIRDSLFDTFDSISTLDLIDGGISLLLRCPGFKTPNKFSVEDITVDIYVSPRELIEGGTEMSKAIAGIVQSFGGNIALPYLQRFQVRCVKEGIKAPVVPLSGTTWKTGKPYLPAPVVKNGPYIRCKCRPGPTSTFAQDRLAPRPSAEIDIPVSEEWIREASLIAAQYDDPVAINKTATQTAPHQIQNKDNSSQETFSVVQAVPTRDTATHHNKEDGPQGTLGTIQTPTAAPRQNKEDGFQGAIVSIGVHTDSILDQFGLDDSLIPRLRILTRNVRSSRWEAALRGPGFLLSYKQASKLSEGMLKDIAGTPDAVSKSSSNVIKSPIIWIYLIVVTTALATIVAILYV